MSQSKLNEALEYSNFSASVRNVDVTVKVKAHVPDFKYGMHLDNDELDNLLDVYCDTVSKRGC